ncbi:hypothetical protein BDZ91DRAFT_724809 [Kalaharituber pfeilii]|nr:hypothetical protein BDZ91DRAFT_724809 [Kalaharituber pfeilii]
MVSRTVARSAEQLLRCGSTSHLTLSMLQAKLNLYLFVMYAWIMIVCLARSDQGHVRFWNF